MLRLLPAAVFFICIAVPLEAETVAYETPICHCTADFDAKKVSAKRIQDSMEFATGHWMEKHSPSGAGLFCGPGNAIDHGQQRIVPMDFAARLPKVREDIARESQGALAYVKGLNLLPELEPFRQAELRSIELSEALGLRKMDFFLTMDPKRLQEPLNGMPIPKACSDFASVPLIGDESARMRAWERLAKARCQSETHSDRKRICAQNFEVGKTRVAEDRSAACYAVIFDWHNCVNERFRRSDPDAEMKMSELVKKYVRREKCDCQNTD
jgi:hypothetical protein